MLINKRLHMKNTIRYLFVTPNHQQWNCYEDIGMKMFDPLQRQETRSTLRNIKSGHVTETILSSEIIQRLLVLW